MPNSEHIIKMLGNRNQEYLRALSLSNPYSAPLKRQSRPASGQSHHNTTYHLITTRPLQSTSDMTDYHYSDRHRAHVHIYRHPPIIKWEVKNRTLPMALAKRLVLLGWNFACMPLWAKLADSSRRFLISALEAEIWVPLGGWHGGPKITKKFFFQFWVFLVRSLTLRCFMID